MAQTIRMYNLEVEPLANFLIDLKLKGRDSRMRTRFIKQLQERLQLIRDEHLELIKQHSHLNEDGEPKTKEVDGQQVYDVKDQNAFNIEYQELMGEEFVIEVTESNKSMIEVLSNAILDSDEEYSGQDALVYDRFCDILEGIE